MAAVVDVRLKLSVQEPNNLKPAISNMQRELNGVNVTLNPKLDTSAARNVNSLNTSIAALTKNLGSTQNAARGVARDLRNVQIPQTAAAGVNGLNKNIGSTVGTLSRLQSQIVGASSEMQRFGEQTAKTATRFASFYVIVQGLRLVENSISDAVKETANFQREMVRISQVGHDSSASIQGIAQEIGRLATTLGADSAELAKVSVTLRQAGLSAEDTRVALDALAKTTLAPTFEDINNTVEGTIAAMQQFGFQAKDFNSILGSMNTVAGAFAVESDDLVTAIRKAGGSFKAAAGDATSSQDAFNQFLAVFTSVRQTTRESAEEISTGLRTIFSRLQNNRVGGQLKELGINLRYTREEAKLLGKDVEGQFVGAYEAVRRLSQATENLSTADPRFSQIAEQIGGYRQISRVIPLLQQFNVAQRAYAIAQAGSNSLTRDAEKAQEAFLVRIQQVRQQFLELVRSLSNNKFLSSLANVTLSLASGLLKVMRVVEPLVPLLTTLAAVKIGSGLVNFVRGVSQGFQNITSPGGIRVAPAPSPVRRQTGGVVPGTGRGDKIPVMAEPGEYIIKRDSAKKIGYERLDSWNRYAEGGFVHMKTGGETNPRKPKPTISRTGKEIKNKDRSEDPDILKVRGQAGPITVRDPHDIPFGLISYQDSTKTGDFTKGLVGRSDSGRTRTVGTAKKSGLLNIVRNVYDKSGLEFTTKKRRDNANGNLGALFTLQGEVEGYKINDKARKKFEQHINELTNNPKAREQNKAYYAKAFKGLNYDDMVANQPSTWKGYEFEEFLRREIGLPTGEARNPNGDFDLPHMEGKTREKLIKLLDIPEGQSPRFRNAEIKYTADQTRFGDVLRKGANAGFYNEDVASLDIETGLKSLTTGKNKLLRPKKFAGGGRVPALLEPGEYRFSKKAAERIGYNNLSEMNDKGRVPQGLAFGGRILDHTKKFGKFAKSVKDDFQNSAAYQTYQVQDESSPMNLKHAVMFYAAEKGINGLKKVRRRYGFHDGGAIGMAGGGEPSDKIRQIEEAYKKLKKRPSVDPVYRADINDEGMASVSAAHLKQLIDSIAELRENSIKQHQEAYAAYLAKNKKKKEKFPPNITQADKELDKQLKEERKSVPVSRPAATQVAPHLSMPVTPIVESEYQHRPESTSTPNVGTGGYDIAPTQLGNLDDIRAHIGNVSSDPQTAIIAARSAGLHPSDYRMFTEDVLSQGPIASAGSVKPPKKKRASRSRKSTATVQPETVSGFRGVRGAEIKSLAESYASGKPYESTGEKTGHIYFAADTGENAIHNASSYAVSRSPDKRHRAYLLHVAPPATNVEDDPGKIWHGEDKQYKRVQNLSAADVPMYQRVRPSSREDYVGGTPLLPVEKSKPKPLQPLLERYNRFIARHQPPVDAATDAETTLSPAPTDAKEKKKRTRKPKTATVAPTVSEATGGGAGGVPPTVTTAAGGADDELNKNVAKLTAATSENTKATKRTADQIKRSAELDRAHGAEAAGEAPFKPARGQRNIGFLDIPTLYKDKPEQIHPLFNAVPEHRRDHKESPLENIPLVQRPIQTGFEWTMPERGKHVRVDIPGQGNVTPPSALRPESIPLDEPDNRTPKAHDPNTIIPFSVKTATTTPIHPIPLDETPEIGLSDRKPLDYIPESSASPFAVESRVRKTIPQEALRRGSIALETPDDKTPHAHAHETVIPFAAQQIAQPDTGPIGLDETPTPHVSIPFAVQPTAAHIHVDHPDEYGVEPRRQVSPQPIPVSAIHGRINEHGIPVVPEVGFHDDYLNDRSKPIPLDTHDIPRVPQPTVGVYDLQHDNENDVYDVEDRRNSARMTSGLPLTSTGKKIDELEQKRNVLEARRKSLEDYDRRPKETQEAFGHRLDAQHRQRVDLYDQISDIENNGIGKLNKKKEPFIAPIGDTGPNGIAVPSEIEFSRQNVIRTPQRKRTRTRPVQEYGVVGSVNPRDNISFDDIISDEVAKSRAPKSANSRFTEGEFARVTARTATHDDPLVSSRPFYGPTPNAYKLDNLNTKITMDDDEESQSRRLSGRMTETRRPIDRLTGEGRVGTPAKMSRPGFKYEAMDQTGKEVKGLIDAIDETVAMQLLHERGLFITKIKGSRFSRVEKAATNAVSTDTGRAGDTHARTRDIDTSAIQRENLEKSLVKRYRDRTPEINDEDAKAKAQRTVKNLDKRGRVSQGLAAVYAGEERFNVSTTTGFSADGTRFDPLEAGKTTRQRSNLSEAEISEKVVRRMGRETDTSQLSRGLQDYHAKNLEQTRPNLSPERRQAAAQALAQRDISNNARYFADNAGNIVGTEKYRGRQSQYADRPIRQSGTSLPLPPSEGPEDSTTALVRRTREAGPVTPRASGVRRVGRAVNSGVNKVFGGYRGSFVPFALASAAPLVEQHAAPFDPETGQGRSTRGVTGALGGAAVGAQLGSIVGPWGTAIGLATGGLVGFYKALSDADKEIKTFQFEKSFKQFESALSDLASGRVENNDANRTLVSSGLNTVRNEAERVTTDEGGGKNYFDRYLGRDTFKGKAAGFAFDAATSGLPQLFLPKKPGNEILGNTQVDIERNASTRRKQVEREKLAPQLPYLQQVGDKIATDMKGLSRDDVTLKPGASQKDIDAARNRRTSAFRDAGGGQIVDTIARIQDIPVEQVQASFDHLIVTTNQARIQQEAYNTTVQSVTVEMQRFSRLGQALDGAVASMATFKQATEDISTTFEGGIAPARTTGFADSANVGGLDRSALERSVQFTTAQIGTSGGGIAKNFGDRILDIDKILRDAPNAVASAAGSTGSGGTETLPDAIKNVFNEGDFKSLGPEMRKRLETAIDAIQPEDLKKRAANPDKLIQELVQEAFGDLPNMFKELTQKIQEQGNNFAEGLAKAAQLQQRAGDSRDKVSVADLNVKRATANLRGVQEGVDPGRFLSLDDIAAPARDKQLRLVGGDNNLAGQPDNIVTRFNDVQKQIAAGRQRLAQPVVGGDKGGSDFTERNNVAEKLNELGTEASNLQAALAQLADGTEVAAAIQEKLNEVEKQRSGQLSFAEKLLTADPKQLREMHEGAHAADVAVRQGTLENLDPSFRAKALEHLRSLQDVQLPGYGGKTGGEVAEGLVNRTRQRVFGPDAARVDDRRVGLNKDLVENAKISREAQSGQANIQESLVKGFITELKGANDAFLAKMDKLLATAKLSDTKSEVARAATVHATAKGINDRAVATDKKFELNDKDNGLERARRIQAAPDLKDYMQSHSLVTKIGKAQESSSKEIYQNGPSDLGSTTTLFGRLIPGITNTKDAKQIDEHRKGIEAFGSELSNRSGLSSDDIQKQVVDPYMASLKESIDKGQYFDPRQRLGELTSSRLSGAYSENVTKESEAGNKVSASAYGTNLTAEDTEKAKTSISYFAENFDQVSAQIAGLPTGINALSTTTTDLANANATLIKLQAQAAVDSQAAQEADARLVDATNKLAEARLAATGTAVVPKTVPASGEVPGMALGGMFRARGTDTVPAMLTPGEFVVNAQATAAHMDVLRKINASKGETVYAATGGRITRKRALDMANESYQKDRDSYQNYLKIGKPKADKQAAATNLRQQGVYHDFVLNAAAMDEASAQRQANALASVKKSYQADLDADPENQTAANALARMSGRTDDTVGPSDEYKKNIERVVSRRKKAGAAKAARYRRSRQGFSFPTQQFSGYDNFGNYQEPPTREPSEDQRKLYSNLYGFARGGMVPRATDTVPALLSPGEFIMNSHAARANLPLLQSMNQTPVYRQAGGPATGAGDAGGAGTGVLGLSPDASGQLSAFNAQFSATVQQFVAPVQQLNGAIQALQGVGTAFTGLSQVLGGFNLAATNLPGNLQPFVNAATALSQVLGQVNIPPTIEVSYNGRHEVILNLPNFAGMKADMAREIIAQIVDQLPAQVEKTIANMPPR